MRWVCFPNTFYIKEISFEAVFVAHKDLGLLNIKYKYLGFRIHICFCLPFGQSCIKYNGNYEWTRMIECEKTRTLFIKCFCCQYFVVLLWYNLIIIFLLYCIVSNHPLLFSTGAWKISLFVVIFFIPNGKKTARK